jgi:outer membrane biosynthesis protein TonB
MFGLAACSNRAKSPVADDALKADLAAATGNASAGAFQLAPKSAQSQVIDAEDAPQSAPQKAAVKHVPKPTPKPAPRLAANRTPQPAPAPAPQATTVTESAPQPQAEQPAPPPAPVMRPQPQPAQQQDKRVYKSEGEIFRQMPWIRP